MPQQASRNSEKNEGGEKPKNMGGQCETENLESDDLVEEEAVREKLVSVKVKDN